MYFKQIKYFFSGLCVGAGTTTVVTIDPQAATTTSFRTIAATATVAGLHCMSSKNLRVPPVARANFHNQVTENGFTKKEYSHVGHFFLTGGFKLISYSRWKSCLVMSNQQPVSSLGSEAVMSGVSVDKRTLEP